MNSDARRNEREEFKRKTGLDVMMRSAEGWMNLSVALSNAGNHAVAKDYEDAMNLRIKQDQTFNE